ncbi:differentially expressed in FDCP 6 homolog [Protopterus annectens]|uniref:differentially expressed in FDCP 6 homolog n=1 Tax=Protopterus annectens TaxID=7888 RepID=UPI001CF99912|nr:differentially expressed in FDCP 6 homolog [Protopterus annectens]
MDLKAELLKSIWYAFTALDVEKSGKVSKSQLKVLSHNLYTALNIPHDPVALEEHFRDNDDGPVSSQGYMPYLNKYILDKVKEGSFQKEQFDELCWMLSAKKNYRPEGITGLVSRRQAFQIWCLFILLSEDKYPLVMVPEEVAYLLKKFTTAMGLEWQQEILDEMYSQNSSYTSGISVWNLLEIIESGRFSAVTTKESFNLAIVDVFQEMYHDVLKKGYLWKKGQVRRNWNERWFVLKPTNIFYYVDEDMKEQKGEIHLDSNTVVEAMPDKEGRRCLFCIKTLNRTFELSASDVRLRQEWMQGIQTAVRLLVEGKTSLHKDLKMKRREQRQQNEKKKLEKEGELSQLKQLQEEKEWQLQQTEEIKKSQMELEERRKELEQQGLKQQEDLQKALEKQLRETEEARASMAAEIEEKKKEAEMQQQKIQELEIMKHKMEMALNYEIEARMEEEKARVAQARLLTEEEIMLKQLMSLKEEQEEMIQKTQQEKEKLQHEMAEKAKELEKAYSELQDLRQTRKQSNQNLVQAEKNLRRASRTVKHWNVQLNRLMQPISPGGRQNKLIISHRGDIALICNDSANNEQQQVSKSSQSESPSEDSSGDPEEGIKDQLEDMAISKDRISPTQPNGVGS